MCPGLKPTPIEIALALATQLEMSFLSSAIKIRAKDLRNDVATKPWIHDKMRKLCLIYLH